MYIIASFKSRIESIMLKKELDKRGLFAEVVSTPKEANIGCGLSVKVNGANLNYLKRVVLTGGFKTFVGFFRVTTTKSGKRVTII